MNEIIQAVSTVGFQIACCASRSYGLPCLIARITDVAVLILTNKLIRTFYQKGV